MADQELLFVKAFPRKPNGLLVIGKCAAELFGSEHYPSRTVLPPKAVAFTFEGCRIFAPVQNTTPLAATS